MTSLYSSIETYFPITGYIATSVADVAVKSYVTFAFFARKEWKKAHLTEKYVCDPLQNLQIKDIYLQYNRLWDWVNDPLYAILP